MIRTITMIVGIVIAVACLAYVIVLVPKLLNTQAGLEIINLRNRTVSDDIIVTWETREDSNGFLYYSVGGNDYSIRDLKYKTTHKLVVENVTGTVTLYVESCTIIGKCGASEYQTVTV